MGLYGWLIEKFIYLVVLVLLIMITYTIMIVNDGTIDNEKGKVYLQALTAIATLALLFYAYSNVASKRDEDAARLELAVRPILVWELESSDGEARFTYGTLKHPIYDFHAKLRLNGEELKFADRHIDVSSGKIVKGRKHDITDFIRRGLSGETSGTIDLLLVCHSEVGGRYELAFSKEVVKAKHGYTFQHRKFVSAKYPWKSQKILFNDDDEG